MLWMLFESMVLPYRNLFGRSKQTEWANGEWDELHFGVVEVFNDFLD
jgi:hypothetical protein